MKSLEKELPANLSVDIVHLMCLYISKDTTEEDIDYVLNTMPEVVEKLRELSPFKVHGRLSSLPLPFKGLF